MSNSPLPIIAVGALGLSSISCVISSFTGFLVSGDSNVESNNSTSNTSTDTSNTSTDTSNTSTEPDYAIPHQIPSGTDGWCWNDGQTVHQDPHRDISQLPYQWHTNRSALLSDRQRSSPD